MKNNAVLLARATLGQLKRGVPPAAGASSIAVGFSSHMQELNRLFAGDVRRRWFAVSSDYGGGKSMFYALAREQALRAGYAVASFEVNRDNGALHEPQTHLADVFRTLQSPLPQYDGQLGVEEIALTWIENCHRDGLDVVFADIGGVQPASPVPRDRGSLLYLITSLADDERTISRNPRLSHRLVDYLSFRGIARGPTARFPAYYRLQILIAWLRATGHTGLFLFIDEVDNILRQIHGKAYPGCFRTLAWYCSSPSLDHLRVVFASTPEVIGLLGPGELQNLSRRLSEQKTVRDEELQGFSQWVRELSREGSPWCHPCPMLSNGQRVRVFDNIAAIHRLAWGTQIAQLAWVDEMARNTQFRTTRRWVKACVTLLDLHQQHKGPGLSQIGVNPTLVTSGAN